MLSRQFNYQGHGLKDTFLIEMTPPPLLRGKMNRLGRVAASLDCVTWLILIVSLTMHELITQVENLTLWADKFAQSA